MKKYDSFCRNLNKVCVAAGAFLLAVVAIITFIQVIQRNITLHSWAWAEEVSRYMVIYAVYLGSGSVFYFDANAKVDLLYNRFPLKVRRILNCVFYIITAVFLCFMFKYGLVYVQRNMKVWCASIHIPWAVPFASLLLGSVNMLLQVPAKIYRTFAKEDGGEE